MQINKSFWNKKNVLITGHTGFKGGWLTVLLNYLGSNIYGYALNPVGEKNFFTLSKINKILKKDYRKDITNLSSLKNCIKYSKPEIIFHLAAQSSVVESFKDSKKTILTNIIGTANILESIKNQPSVKCLVIITTDKVYQNYKISKYFTEESTLGGDDIYSGSKACCEILTNSYNKSFFWNNNVNIATARAGNCFGGGDWTKDRIVKDCLEAFFQNKTLFIRNPKANRPWQHVVEPLTGYLALAQKLCSSKGKKYSGAWNFGPSTKQNMRVINLAKLIKKTTKSKSRITIKKKDQRFTNKKFRVFESKYLNINSKKALKKLKWKSKLSIKSAVGLTVEWHQALIFKKDLLKITLQQIKNYLSKNQ
jgi:CDP-glucose 4,6-dehydratase